MSAALRLQHVNHLLVALSTEELMRLTPCLELVLLPPGFCLHESEAIIPYVYFPTSAVVSLIYEMGDGAMVEVAMVGNDGVVGIAAFLEGESTLSRAIVQNPGYAYRLPVEDLKREFQRAGGLQKTLLRYTQAVLTEMAQALVCVRHHSLEQHFAAGCCCALTACPSTIWSFPRSQLPICSGYVVRRFPKLQSSCGRQG